MGTEQHDRQQILDLVKQYYEDHKKESEEFHEGDRIGYAGRVFDSEEMVNLVDSALDFWLTAGRYCKEFENEFAKKLGIKYCSLVNSGSSANLLAFMALTSPVLGERQIKRGDEVITVAASFPTTVTPMINYGAVPVFLDVTIPGYNIDVTQLENAVTDKTKAVMIAHTLGNPFDIKTVKDFCDKHHLWLIEDNCDALGSTYTLNGETRMTGTFGDIGTSSFYPPHHITMGEGGAVYTNNPKLHKLIVSFRDWGRDCICQSGQDNLCGHRYDGQFGLLPKGYDHKYVYSNFGYNLKATEMQASIGVAQLKKLDSFTEIRKNNYRYLYDGLKDLEQFFILPEATADSDPSWFGFLLTAKEGIDRNKLVRYIEDHNIQTRMLFASNMILHPCFDQMREEGGGYRIISNLKNTDEILKHTFWIGVSPKMNKDKLDYMIKVIHEGIHEVQ